MKNKTKRDRRKRTAVDAPTTEADLGERIARRAYELYLERGGEHHRDLDDWLQAEREILGNAREKEGR